MFSRLSLDSNERAEAALCMQIGSAMSTAPAGDIGALMKAWNGEWRSVYALAELICDRHFREVATQKIAKSKL